MTPKNKITVYLYTDILKLIGYGYAAITSLHFVFMAPTTMGWDISDYTEPVALMLYDTATLIAPIFAVLAWVLFLAVIGVVILWVAKSILSTIKK